MKPTMETTEEREKIRCSLSIRDDVHLLGIKNADRDNRNFSNYVETLILKAARARQCPDSEVMSQPPQPPIGMTGETKTKMDQRITIRLDDELKTALENFCFCKKAIPAGVIRASLVEFLEDRGSLIDGTPTHETKEAV